ncbi:MAG: flagellar FleN [Rhodocyclaceae bacterium]|jgi:flagellar biosynthesis protein FlhG|nr:flagellar FleN [Rhodocyclaceae bacterium]
MIDPREDQAAGLRRLFRKAPPTVVALYATGRNKLSTTVQTAYGIAGHSDRVLILDEATGSDALASVFDLPAGPDLLSVLGDRVSETSLIQPIPGLLGRVPVSAAALALPLLDDERRARLVAALRALYRHAGFVLVHSTCEAAADPSPFVFSAPRRLVVAEASRSGATESYQLIKRLAAAGAGSLHVAVARARDRDEARAFFNSLNGLVRRHIGVPLAWLGEIERDNLSAGLLQEAAASSQRGAETAFLRRLETLARSTPLNGLAGAR